MFTQILSQTFFFYSSTSILKFLRSPRFLFFSFVEFRETGMKKNREFLQMIVNFDKRLQEKNHEIRQKIAKKSAKRCGKG